MTTLVLALVTQIAKVCTWDMSCASFKVVVAVFDVHIIVTFPPDSFAEEECMHVTCYRGNAVLFSAEKPQARQRDLHEWRDLRKCDYSPFISYCIYSSPKSIPASELSCARIVELPPVSLIMMNSHSYCAHSGSSALPFYHLILFSGSHSSAHSFGILFVGSFLSSCNKK